MQNLYLVTQNLGGFDMNLFSIDSPFYRAASEVADVLILLVFWFLGCLPIITIGASTTAFFYVAGKKVRKEEAYITKDFFKSFKQNFKQSILITIIFIIIWVSGILYYQMAQQIVVSGSAEGIERIIPPISIIYNIEAIVMTIYVFAVLSRFNMKTKNIFITSFVLAHRHLMTTLAILGTICISYLLMLFIPVCMFLFPISVVFVSSFFLQKIFKRYVDIKDNSLDETDNNKADNSEESNDIEPDKNDEI